MTLSPLSLDIDALAIGSPPVIAMDLIKAHCGIDGGAFDDQLALYLAAAIEWAEGAMRRTIYARPHRWVLRDFPRARDPSILLPRGRTASVASIAYVQDGQTVTLTGPSSSPAGTDWREDLGSPSGGLLLPPRGEAWPGVDRDSPAPVKITFTAGWESDDVPPDIVHAILFAVADAVDIRGTGDLNAHGGGLDARLALLSSWDIVRWY